MKATLLIENHCLFNTYYNAEHGYSAWIEDEGVKVLFDTGYSDKFIHNAHDMNIDLRTADYVVLSHGHIDHTGGLKYLMKFYQDNAMFRKPVLLMADPVIMNKKFHFGFGYHVGMDVSLEELSKQFHLRFESKPIWLTESLVYMGKTETSNDYEGIRPQIAKVLIDSEWQDDYVIEETQLAFRHENGTDITVLAACAHQGMCNIMEYAKKVTGGSHIHTYLGGSHLLSGEVSPEQLDKTCDYVAREKIDRFHVCHCTDLKCLVRLANTCPVEETGVGLVVESK